jgi:hypothetical protein
MARQHRSNNRAAGRVLDSFWSREPTDETDGHNEVLKRIVFIYDGLP